MYGGKGVYTARAILHLKIRDQVPAMRKSLQQNSIIAKEETRRGLLQPNPAKNKVNFTYPEDETEEVIIKLYNAFGQLVMEGKVTQKIDFDVSTYRQGIYFIHVFESGIEKESHKLVIIK